MANILKKIGSFISEAFETIVLALIIFVIIYYLVARPHQVKGLSMYPTFHDKELILTDRLSYRFSTPKKGDVIVFTSPTDPNVDYIKRIIGLPGDKIKISADGVYVNDLKLDESAYLQPTIITSGGLFTPLDSEVVVPKVPSSFFVMGDNRPESSDSRTWGFVKKDEIIGKVFLRYYPFDKFGLIKTP